MNILLVVQTTFSPFFFPSVFLHYLGVWLDGLIHELFKLGVQESPPLRRGECGIITCARLHLPVSCSSR